jgi:hypothetical protein
MADLGFGEVSSILVALVVTNDHLVSLTAKNDLNYQEPSESVGGPYQIDSGMRN